MRSKKITRRVKRKTNKRRNNRRLTNKFRKYKKIIGGDDSLLSRPLPLTIRSTRSRGEALEVPQELDERRANKQKRELEEAAKKESEQEARMYKRRNTRSSDVAIIPVKKVVSSEGGYDSHSQVDATKITQFVLLNIQPGPQEVVLPVSNMLHSILVDVQPDKIMISDWKGDPRKMFPLDEPRYQNYFQLIDNLSNKYGGIPVIFYEIDKKLLTSAQCTHEQKGNRGGCSEYTDLWKTKYYKNGFYQEPTLI